MKEQLKDYIKLANDFMRKHYILFISLKVVKVLVVLFFLSCEHKGNTTKRPDTIKVDSIYGNHAEDSVIFRNQERSQPAPETLSADEHS
jgi:hypothetical protein